MKISRRQLRAMISEQAEDMTVKVTKDDMDNVKKTISKDVDLDKLKGFMLDEKKPLDQLFARVFKEILNKRQRNQLLELAIETMRDMGFKEDALVQARGEFIKALLDAYNK